MANSLERVTATPAALERIEELRQRLGPLIFFQSDGCEGSTPMCYPAGEFSPSDTDVYLGNLGGTPFYMGFEQFGRCGHIQLVIDVGAGSGARSPLDRQADCRFLSRPRRFTEEESALLNAGRRTTAFEPQQQGDDRA
jgi:uncharacterized protein (DUF779 family)